ncbi:MAG TPA: thioredoxin family protein [Firmicutes bacterium]|nr:thioredoxin family protein [Bacillota bacterium]
MRIEICGVGCAKCRKTEQLIEEVVRKAGVQAEIVHITDLNEIIDRGVVMTPAVFVDGVKKIEGKVPSESQIRQWVGKE